MICPNCGAQVEDGTKFCSNCGTQIADATIRVEQPIPAAQTTPVPPLPQNAPTQEIPNQQQPPYVQEATQQMPPQGSQQPAWQTPQQPPKQSNGMGTGALVCGIVSIVLALTFILAPLGIIVGIVSIVLGAMAKKKTPPGKAKVGMVLGIVGSVLSVIILVITVAFAAYLPQLINNSSSSVSSVTTSRSSKASSSSTNSSSKSSSTKSSSSSSKSTSGSTYANARYGYSLTVPSGFEKIAESANGDGATFRSVDKNMKFVIYGYNNTDKLDANKIIEGLWNGSSDSKTQKGDGWETLIQYEGDQRMYYCVFVGTGSIVRVEVTGYAGGGSDFETVCDQIAKSVVVGDLSKTH